MLCPVLSWVQGLQVSRARPGSGLAADPHVPALPRPGIRFWTILAVAPAGNGSVLAEKRGCQAAQTDGRSEAALPG